MIFQWEVIVQEILIIIVIAFVFSIATYIAGAICKKDTGRQGYGSAFFLALIFILVLNYVLNPYVFGPVITIPWLQVIIIFLLLLVLFAIFYSISFGGALLAAIICLVILWLIQLLLDFVFPFFSVAAPQLFPIIF